MEEVGLLITVRSTLNNLMGFRRLTFSARLLSRNTPLAFSSSNRSLDLMPFTNVSAWEVVNEANWSLWTMSYVLKSCLGPSPETLLSQRVDLTAPSGGVVVEFAELGGVADCEEAEAGVAADAFFSPIGVAF